MTGVGQVVGFTGRKEREAWRGGGAGGGQEKTSHDFQSIAMTFICQVTNIRNRPTLHSEQELSPGGSVPQVVSLLGGAVPTEPYKGAGAPDSCSLSLIPS